MRYKWRNWVVFDCNWKTGLEAFMEPYHVTRTHAQLLEYGEYYAYSAAYGLHGVSGFDERDPEMKQKGGSSVTRAGKGIDPASRPISWSTRTGRRSKTPALPGRWSTPRNVWSTNCQRTLPRRKWSGTGSILPQGTTLRAA